MNQPIISSAEAPEFLENIIAVTPGHVYWKDREGVYLGCNDLQAKTLGLKSRKDIIGKTDYDLAWKNQAGDIRKVDMEIIKKGTENTVEEPVTLEDGRAAIFLSKKLPLRDKNDNIIGIVGISFDITERKKTEQKLNEALSKLSSALNSAEEANKAKSNFLSIVSHELTNFVGSVHSSLELIKLSIPSQENDIKKYLKICDESLNTILPFIQNVSRYFQIEGTGINSKLNITNIIDTITTAINNHSQNQENIHVLIDITNSVPKEILIDNLNFFKVFNIIISNAFRFTEKGSICVRVYIEDNLLITEVNDTGKGMYPEQINNIFNAFPIDKNASVRYKKFGIKLSIAKKIVELLGGNLEISSQLNVGTCVSIKTPFQTVDFPNEFIKNDQNTGNKLLIKKILVVEDDKRTLELIGILLNNLGYKSIDLIESGSDAIEKVKANNYDLIFMDITLPDISGVEVTQIIQERLNKNIPIVAVTSHNTEDAVDEFLAKGFIYVIPKPISLANFDKFFSELPKFLEDD